MFNSPIDKIVFDVSHQTYAHKALTGRAYTYIDPERYGEASGFANPDESEHDLFAMGHTSTSVSLGCGLAHARDLAGDAYNVITIIGDGSLSGGLAFEGFNNAAELDSNLIIIVNDTAAALTIQGFFGCFYFFAHLKFLRKMKIALPIFFGRALCFGLSILLLRA